jgi:hypothetical protein
MEHFLAKLEFTGTIDHVADLERLGMHVQAGLETGFALLVENLERTIRVVGGYLASGDIGPRIDIALAGG